MRGLRPEAGNPTGDCAGVAMVSRGAERQREGLPHVRSCLMHADMRPQAAVESFVLHYFAHHTDTAWQTTRCMTTSISDLTAPCRTVWCASFVEKILISNILKTFQLTMHSPGYTRRPKTSATLSVGTSGFISLHRAAFAQRDSRRPHIARRRINLFSDRVVLVRCFVAARSASDCPTKAGNDTY